MPKKKRITLTIDSSMGTVCPTPLFLCLVYLNMGYVKWIHIQAFHLKQKPKPTMINLGWEGPNGENINKKMECWDQYFCIAFCVFEQVKNKLCRFNGPASLPIWMTVLRLSSTPNSTTEPGEWNGLLVDKNILQVPFSLRQRQLPNSMGCFSRVLSTNDKKTFE